MFNITDSESQDNTSGNVPSLFELEKAVRAVAGEMPIGATRTGGDEDPRAPGGLSTVHKCTLPAVTVWRGGSLLSARRFRAPGDQVDQAGGKRGKAQFSTASRRRLMRKVAMTRRDYYPKFVTLTYPAEFPFDPKEWKRHIKNFVARLRRHYISACGIWKLEPQKRGAPHYHLLVWGVSYTDLRGFVPQAWYEVVGSGDEKHLKAGTRVEWVRSWGGVMAYASKYLGKLPKPEECPQLWDQVGRYWAVFGVDDIPWADQTIVYISDRQAVQLIRYLRRFGHIPSRAFKSLTVFADGDFWFDRLDRLLCEGENTFQLKEGR